MARCELEAHLAVGVTVVDEDVRVAPLVLDPHGGRVQIKLDRVVQLAAHTLEIRVEVDPLGHARLEREVRAERGVHHAGDVEERGADVQAAGVRRPQGRRLPVRVRHVGEDREQDHALHRQALASRVLGRETEAEHGHFVELIGVGPGRELLRELDAEGVAHHDLAVHGVDGEVAGRGFGGIDVLGDAGVGLDARVFGLHGVAADLPLERIRLVPLERAAAGGDGKGGDGQERTHLVSMPQVGELAEIGLLLVERK